MSQYNKDDQSRASSAASTGGIVFMRDKSTFLLSSELVMLLAEKKVDFSVLLTYILLARGVGQLDGRRTTATNHGYIMSKTQWSDATVTRSVDWLKQHDYIEMVEVLIHKEKQNHWLIKDGRLDIALPNTLIDGNSVTPLIRLYSPRIISEEEDLKQIDHLVTLCLLYLYNDMNQYGGINPRIGLYRQWSDFDETHNIPVVNMVNSDAAIYEAKGRTEVIFIPFVNHLFTYIEAMDERAARIANSLQRLVLSGFLYEAVQIWDGNPVAKEGTEAVPLYTIYIHDPISKTDEPALQKTIQRVAYRLGIKDGYKEFTEEDYERGDDVKFRYVADKQVGGYPIGIFRLRFRAGSDLDVVSVDAERRRASAWLRELQVLNYLRH